MPTKSPATTEPLPTPQKQTAPESSTSREAIFDIFRRWGYLQAIARPARPIPPARALSHRHAPEGDFAAEARRYYCGNFAVEFMHIPILEQRQWIQDAN